MDQRSNKHGPRLDDELRHETESIVDGAPVEAHAEEFREQEPLDEQGRPGDPIEARAELARRLEPSVFPAERDDLLASAERKHAPDWLLDALKGLPDAAYPTTESVWRAMAEA